MNRTEFSDFLYSIFDSIKMFFSDIVFISKFKIYKFIKTLLCGLLLTILKKAV